MKRKPIRLAAAAAVIVVAGLAVVLLAGGGAAAGTVDMHHGKVNFAKGEETKILNEVDAAAADTPPDDLVAKGRQMFRNPDLFMKGESCQTCHAEGSASPELGTMTHDRNATGAGIDGMKDFNGPRDAPALWGLAKTAPYFWDGSVRSLNAAILRPVKGHMKDFVDGECTNPSGAAKQDECDQEAADRVAALTAYVKTLDPPTTAFDEGQLSADAKAGEKLFQGKGGCIECHGGPLFTDNLIHNTGVPQVTFKSPTAPVTRSRATTPARRRRRRTRRAPAPPRPRAARSSPGRGPRSSTPRSCATSRHGAVHAQRRVQDARGGRPVLQHAAPRSARSA